MCQAEEELKNKIVEDKEEKKIVSEWTTENQVRVGGDLIRQALPVYNDPCVDWDEEIPF